MAKTEKSSSELIADFQRAMANEGFVPDGDIRVGEIVRFDAPGDKAGKNNGWYKLILDDNPIGFWGDWKADDIKHRWTPRKGSRLTKSDRKQIEQAQKERAEKIEAGHLEAAQKAEELLKECPKARGDHPYFTAKGVEDPRGLAMRPVQNETLIVVPMYAFTDGGRQKLWNLQHIDGKGQKNFLTGARVEGCFWFRKGAGETTIICEGVATAMSIFEATGYNVVCAFNAGNLVPVATALQEHRPSLKLFIAGDDDAEEPEDWDKKGGGRKWNNAGKTKAKAAAKAVGCPWVLPEFVEGQARAGRTDFNDLHKVEGIEAVEAQIAALVDGKPEGKQAKAEVVSIDERRDENWQSMVPHTERGIPDGNNIVGVRVYLEYHPRLKDRLAFNDFTGMMEVDGRAVEDDDYTEFRDVMHSDGLKARKSDVIDQMERLGRFNRYDPLANYLNGLQWDETKRLDSWLEVCLGVEPSPYSKVIGRKFLVAMVTRALRPGVKFDNMLVLEGPQGAGKSTALRYLAGDDYFCDDLPDMHSKDAMAMLQGAWMVEVAEMSALTKSDVKQVKKFLSKASDKYRPPYGRNPIEVQRRCVFGGSVNPDGSGYLSDPTGARRFWPVRCSNIDTTLILKLRDQLFAEAVTAFKAGEHIWLDNAAIRREAQAEQAARNEIDPWFDDVADFVQPLRTVLPSQILREAIGMTKDRIELKHSRRVGAILSKLGWEKPTKTEWDAASKTTVRLWRKKPDDGIEDDSVDKLFDN